VAVKNRSLNVLSQKAAAIANAPFDHLAFTIEPVTADPHNLLITAEMMHTMQQAIQSLPPRCQIIFKLIREDGLSYKDTAEILNISVNTIDAQMAIAVKKICMALNIHRPLLSKKKS
jgi:RNA polymerase sigma-70 factor (ECF subfamily)